MQREQQKKLADELFVPISGQIQPESIESRIALYEKRWEYEEQNIPHRITKQRFLNWRLTEGLLRIQKRVIPAHFLPYSTLKSGYSRGKVEYRIGQVHYMNRDEVRFISLAYFNQLCNCSYSSVKELIFSPPPFETELQARRIIEAEFFSLSAILVVDEIPEKKIEILCKSETFSDVREVLLRPPKQT
jgi:hypothetical protein